MLARAARQQHRLLRQLLPAAAQASQLQQERGIKLLEVGAAYMYTRRAVGLRLAGGGREVAAPSLPPAECRQQPAAAVLLRAQLPCRYSARSRGGSAERI
jgi:hypothetical protein